MRRTTVIVSLAMAAAACGTGADAAGEGGTTTQPSTSTTSITTTTTMATTTTADPCASEPFSIDDRGGRLIPGCIHRTDAFGPSQVTFTTDDDWWLTFAQPDPRLVLLGLDTDGDGGLDGSMAFVVWNAELAPDELLTELGAIDGIDADSPSTPATVAAQSALAADFVAAEDPLLTSNPCTFSGVRFGSDSPGFQLITAGRKQDIGFPACNRTRVWAVEVSDQTTLILAAAHYLDDFDDLIPVFEDFLVNSVTFGDG